MLVNTKQGSIMPAICFTSTSDNYLPFYYNHKFEESPESYFYIIFSELSRTLLSTASIFCWVKIVLRNLDDTIFSKDIAHWLTVCVINFENIW